MKKTYLSSEEISLIKEMAKNNCSLNEISKELKKSKTTVYYWFLKFRGRKLKPLSIDRSDEFLIGQFVGAFAGDGNFFFDKKRYHYRIIFA